MTRKSWLAAARQPSCSVGHVERFNPAIQAAAPMPATTYIEAVRTSGFTFRSTDIGVVLDLMIHDLDLVLSLVPSTRSCESMPGRPWSPSTKTWPSAESNSLSAAWPS